MPLFSITIEEYREVLRQRREKLSDKLFTEKRLLDNACPLRPCIHCGKEVYVYKYDYTLLHFKDYEVMSKQEIKELGNGYWCDDQKRETTAEWDEKDKPTGYVVYNLTAKRISVEEFEKRKEEFKKMSQDIEKKIGRIADMEDAL